MLIPFALLQNLVDIRGWRVVRVDGIEFKVSCLAIKINALMRVKQAAFCIAPAPVHPDDLALEIARAENFIEDQPYMMRCRTITVYKNAPRILQRPSTLLNTLLHERLVLFDTSPRIRKAILPARISCFRPLYP